MCRIMIGIVCVIYRWVKIFEYQWERLWERKCHQIWPHHRAIFGTFFENLSVWYGQIWREKKGVPAPKETMENIDLRGARPSPREPDRST